METVTNIQDKARRAKPADASPVAASEAGQADDPGFTDGPDNPNIRKPEDFKEEDGGPKKGKRAKKSADAAAALDVEITAATDDQAAGASTELVIDPHLFEELDHLRIPKLEKRARSLAAKRDEIKILQSEEKGIAEECYLIMNDHNIEHYSDGGVTLNITRKPKIIVELD